MKSLLLLPLILLSSLPAQAYGTSGSRCYKDVWREDKDRANMSYTINSVANKNRKAIKEWEAANPTYMEDDVLMREYLKMVQAVMKPLCENEDNNTIIQKVSEIKNKDHMII